MPFAIRHRRSAGFTLIEMLVVVAVIGIITALASPRVHRALPGLELRSAAHELAAAARSARARAIADGAPAALSLDLTTGGFTISPRGGGGALPEGLAIEATAATEALDTGRSMAEFRFYPDGSAMGGRITVSRDDSAYAVDIDWLTGRVKILRL